MSVVRKRQPARKTVAELEKVIDTLQEQLTHKKKKINVLEIELNKYNEITNHLYIKLAPFEEEYIYRSPGIHFWTKHIPRSDEYFSHIKEVMWNRDLEGYISCTGDDIWIAGPIQDEVRDAIDLRTAALHGIFFDAVTSGEMDEIRRGRLE